MQDNALVSKNEVDFPRVTEQQIQWGRQKDLHQADRYKAIVNADSGKLFAIVSQKYKLIRHEEAIEQVEDAIQESPALGEYKVRTAFYNDGGRMRRKYIFPEVEVEIKEGDVVNPELQLFNSYDTTWPFIVILGAFRLICTNGLVIGEKYLHLRKRHIFHFDQIDLKEQISTALERFKLQTTQWERWTGQTLTVKTYSQVMETMKFGKAALEEVETRVQQEAEDYSDTGFPITSVWIFYNVVTWYITHRAVSLNHRVVMERRLRSAMNHLKV